MMQTDPGWQPCTLTSSSTIATLLALGWHISGSLFFSFVLTYYFHLWLYYCCNIVLSSPKPPVSDGGLNIYTTDYLYQGSSPNPQHMCSLQRGRRVRSLEFTVTARSLIISAVSLRPWWLAAVGSILYIYIGFLHSWKFLESYFLMFYRQFIYLFKSVFNNDE